MNPAEKERFANKASKALDHPSVENVMAEFADNMGFELTGLPEYGLRKVAHYAALVARAQALDIDPDELRYTEDEAEAALWERAFRYVLKGIPTRVVRR